jgi:hypothetical protein
MIIETTSRRQGFTCEGRPEGSLIANPRGDEQESYRRPSTWMSEPMVTKSIGRGYKVNVTLAGRKIMFLPGEACNSCDRKAIAPFLVIGEARLQESAEGILVRWHS